VQRCFQFPDLFLSTLDHPFPRISIVKSESYCDRARHRKTPKIQTIPATQSDSSSYGSGIRGIARSDHAGHRQAFRGLGVVREWNETPNMRKAYCAGYAPYNRELSPIFGDSLIGQAAVVVG
jgi:hypothetical protein